MVRDIPRAIRFYESIGFALRGQDVPNDPRYAVILRDAVELHLQWHDAKEWDSPNDRPTYRFLGETWTNCSRSSPPALRIRTSGRRSIHRGARGNSTCEIPT